MKYFFSFLFICQLTFGGSERVGNGGGVLVCNNRPTILLDYYEGKKRGLSYKTISSMTPREMNDLLDSRIRFFLPVLADIIKDLRKTFYDRKENLYNASFQIPDDFLAVNLPRNCQLKVAAVQRVPLFSFENIFFLDQNIYQRLDRVSQNGLILHEILYFISLAEGSTNSVNTRKALAYIMSDQFTYSYQDFNKYFILHISKSLEIFDEDDSGQISDYWDSLFPEELKWIHFCDRFIKRGYHCPKGIY